MDTKVIEINKNILVHQTLAGNAGVASFTFTLDVEFIPDVVRVKNISYVTAAAETNMCYIRSDLIDNRNLASFYGDAIFAYTSSPNLSFILRKPVNGTYTFTCIDQGGNNARNGDLMIHLDFVKYKEVKESKIY